MRLAYVGRVPPANMPSSNKKMAGGTRPTKVEARAA
jgi:hypothetical protein